MVEERIVNFVIKRLGGSLILIVSLILKQFAVLNAEFVALFLHRRSHSEILYFRTSVYICFDNPFILLIGSTS